MRTLRVPDIAGVEIPAGPFVYQDGERRELPTFWIARYPVTNLQYQTFIDDNGYRNDRWWRDLERPQPAVPRWPQPNRPRTNVNGYEAVAFSRWLTGRLGLAEGSIRLPTELEWEKAARGEEGLRYPWGKEYRSGFANVFETDNIQTGPWYLDQPTAVGVYPHAASVYGVEDLCGTIWEWCFNSDSTDDDEPRGNKHFPRVQRGGSWLNYVAVTGGDSRQRIEPGVRNDVGGLRLVLTRDIARGLADSQPA